MTSIQELKKIAQQNVQEKHIESEQNQKKLHEQANEKVAEVFAGLVACDFTIQDAVTDDIVRQFEKYPKTTNGLITISFDYPHQAQSGLRSVLYNLKKDFDYQNENLGVARQDIENAYVEAIVDYVDRNLPSISGLYFETIQGGTDFPSMPINCVITAVIE